ncbi:hypothetical protein ABMS01_07390 [Lentilactobacillus parabuchneri]|uniref:hypothetical protein n=1 Tax=Lentilactobacillus parabuchneri TaxID=152331 RepID=UPI0038624D93
MNTKSKYRLTLLFSLLVFGSFGVSSQANADTTDTIQSTAKTVESSVTVKPTAADSTSGDSVAAQVQDSKATTTSSGNDEKDVTTSYGDAKNNQVDPSTNKDDSNTDASTDQTADTSNTDKDSAQMTGSTASSSDQSSANETDTKDTDAKDTSADSDTPTEPITDVNTDTSVADDSAVDKAVKTVVDKVVPATDSETSDQATSQTASSAATEPDDGLIPPDQSVIERKPSPNDISGGTFAETVKKSDPKVTKQTVVAGKNKTKLLTVNAFSNSIYKHVLRSAKTPGKITTTSGHKVTLTTPVKHVKYSEHDSTAISETLPIVITIAIIAVAGITFIAFDPLKFLFK